MLTCEFCTKEYETSNRLKNHQHRCHSNPNRKVSKGNTGNKGKNQYSYGKVCSETTKMKISAANTGRVHSTETKQLLSEKRKAFLDANPDKVPYKLNHSSKQSYPERYFSECFPSATVEHRVGRYWLDFANVEHKLYLEIDGEQHYVDAKIVEHDQVRTTWLISQGWTGYRVRWSEFQRLDDDAKTKYVENLRCMMKWRS